MFVGWCELCGLFDDCDVDFVYCVMKCVCGGYYVVIGNCVEFVECVVGVIEFVF